MLMGWEVKDRDEKQGTFAYLGCTYDHTYSPDGYGLLKRGWEGEGRLGTCDRNRPDPNRKAANADLEGKERQGRGA